MADKVIPVRVALRIRPLNNKEKMDACEECLRTIPGENQVILGKNKAFTYDYVFCQKSPQVEIYETCVKTLLDSLFKGYNATVLAYGQTGSGKTHTMGSGYTSLVCATHQDFENVGVIPRVLSDLFNTIEMEKEKEPDSTFTVKVSFVEVYNEEIKDLFINGVSDPLNIREENNSIRVVGLSETEVNDANQTIQMLEKGSANRMTGGTAMNEQSSRSHAIFTIALEQFNPNNGNDLVKSKFHLVDLAGSERQSKTKAEGIRLKEGININLGLLALGNVISVLGEDNVKHVPYRESKLTRLLQDSLGGNSHTLMIACASPADSNMEETLNSLRYADRARKIKNKPIINIDPQLAELNNLKEQVQFLKAQILQLTGGCGLMPEYNPDASKDSSKLKEENEKLKSENEKLFVELRRVTSINRHNFDRITRLEKEKEDLNFLLKDKFDEIKLAFAKISEEEQQASTSTESTANGDEKEAATPNPEGTAPTDEDGVVSKKKMRLSTTKSLISELQSKLGEFEQLRDKPSEPAQNEEETAETEVQGDPAVEKEFTLRQAQMQFQLTEYDSDLQRKQALHSKMLDNLTRSHASMGNMDELKSRIQSLESEKLDLQRLINSSDRKLTEQKKERLKALEHEVSDLRRKEKELQRMYKLKEENEKQCEKLKNEISQIKSDRVKLIKQMKADNDKFRMYKTEKEREVSQLKAQERKRLVEISKLQSGQSRQEAILKRKNDEIHRIQKQLRDTADKQKLVAAQRQQTFDRKDSSQLGDRLRSWITMELEASVFLAEARLNLNKLIDLRKGLNAELITLTDRYDRLGENSGMPPPLKNPRKNQDMDSTYVASTCDEEESDETKRRAELEKRIERIKEEIEMKNVQINETQQILIDGDQDDKAKHMFNNIHGLLEAKVVLKHLYSTGVQFMLDSKLKQEKFETDTNGLTQEIKDYKKKLDALEEEFKLYKKENNNETSRLIQHYEQRILILLKSGIQNPECVADERFNLMMEQIKSMEKKMDKPNRQVKIERRSVRRSVAQNDANAENQHHSHRESLLGQASEFKRTQRIKRDHRRTRVIRAEDVEPLQDRFRDEPIKEERAVSPTAEDPGSPSCRVPPTPNADDKNKDPDWVNPWIRTPLGAKTRSNNSTYLRKAPRLSKKSSRTKLLPTTLEQANFSDTENAENEENTIPMVN